MAGATPGIDSRARREPAKADIPGARLCVKSALLHVGNSSMRVFHKMFDETTGELVATEDQLGVLLDMDARRPTPLSDEMRARAKAMLAPV